jgi:RNA polymerase sigma factor (sigma-70 family)
VSVSLSHVDGPADAELIAAVRGGDLDAYGELYARHVDAARRLARQLTSPADADDLVSDAFTKVLTVLQRGGGPDLAFRAYLLTAVRRLHVDRIRAGSRLRPVDDLTPFDPGLPFHDTAIEGFDNAAAAKAFSTLPERWQMVLWHTEVEGQKPADIAPLLGMSANSVAALAYRAREGLRQAFLNQHAADLDDVDCAWTRDHLGAYVRGGLSRRDAGKVDDHLAGCRACAAVYLELTEVNSGLAGLLAPLLLGAAGAGYLSAAHGGTAAAAGGAVSSGLAGARAWVSTHASLAAVGGVAVTATALLAVYGVSHFNGNEAADAGTNLVPGVSGGTDTGAPGPSTSTQPAHASRTPQIVVPNPGASLLPSAGPSESAPSSTATSPSTEPSSPATSQPTEPSSAPSSAPTSQPTQPSSPPTSQPPGDVTFTSTPPSHPAIGSTYTVRASGGSGAIRFSIDPATTNAACSMVDASTVSFDHAGTCVIAADVTAKLAPVVHALQTIAVPQTAQTITFDSTPPTDAVVDGTYDVRATSTSGRDVTFSTNAACSVTGGTVTFVHALPCVVTATQPGDADLASASDSQTIDPVAKAAQAITLVPKAPDTATVGATYTYTATGGRSGNPVHVTTNNGDICAVSEETGTVAFNSPGTCLIRADQEGNADYDAAPTVALAVKVVPQNDSDLAVTAEKTDAIGGLSGVKATVTGVPQGQTALLTAQASGKAAFRKDPSDTACKDVGDSTWECVVTPEDTVFTFAVNTEQGRDVTFTVTPVAPLTDPNPDNNKAGIHWD